MKKIDKYLFDNSQTYEEYNNIDTMKSRVMKYIETNQIILNSDYVINKHPIIITALQLKLKEIQSIKQLTWQKTFTSKQRERIILYIRSYLIKNLSTTNIPNDILTNYSQQIEKIHIFQCSNQIDYENMLLNDFKILIEWFTNLIIN